jgi:poly-gamma-glutamate synthesis protein (capsule biosynthesis protein)
VTESKLAAIISVLLIFATFSSCAGTGERSDSAPLSYHSLFESDNNIYTVLFAGDLLIASRGLEVIHRKGPDYPFARLSQEINRHDLVFVNLETPITNRGAPPVDKYYLFRLDDYAALSLKNLKIDAVSLANNHILDYGIEGMEDTIDYLNRRGIAYSGAGKNIQEARKPAYLQTGGLDIYILSYCERPPDAFYAAENKPGTARMILSDIIDDVNRYSYRGSQVFVSLHWGIERTANPTEEQISTGRAIIDAGAEAVIGHHPHWPQGIELRGGKPIFYSLGNFYSGFGINNDMDNLMAVFHIKHR